MSKRTLTEGFDDFLDRITPSSFETDAAKSHRASIEKCLKDNFGMKNFFRTGSFGNGTNISRFSDVDYFAVIPAVNLKKESSKSLSAIRDVLNTRFFSTNVRVNCPAVSLPFGTDAKEMTEVVPSYYIKDDYRGYQIYGIPDCNNGWMNASPVAHNAYVREKDNKLSNKLKQLIRLLKAWKYYCNVPILSFYLELRTTKCCETMDGIVYIYDIKHVFKYLYDCELSQMQDPMGISGYINPCRSDNQIEESMSKLSTALTRSEYALDAFNKNDIEKTFNYLDKIFDGNFPSYYK
ncbi:MAG: hypothetical protein A2X61_08795 [Ignavibacteria bacterium GWB2_35_12]|nr:MAG: hypothetical protein A2X61_08795 [Ignavibacteria bacterium GWB2_35_12]OGU91656.1 MAG: hypothetical protein A2220_10445 [Ignavibacteria bacterium RIFOXYA2_FULL_35_10]OGV22626.1 MAG: hypothetical protein A2475_12990 [Ignavibacteria bacterium RIFOXYC2_FULL_35_21]